MRLAEARVQLFSPGLAGKKHGAIPQHLEGLAEAFDEQVEEGPLGGGPPAVERARGVLFEHSPAGASAHTPAHGFRL